VTRSEHEWHDYIVRTRAGDNKEIKTEGDAKPAQEEEGQLEAAYRDVNGSYLKYSIKFGWRFFDKSR